MVQDLFFWSLSHKYHNNPLSTAIQEKLKEVPVCEVIHELDQNVDFFLNVGKSSLPLGSID
jgi:hypothetical protein